MDGLKKLKNQYYQGKKNRLSIINRGSLSIDNSSSDVRGRKSGSVTTLINTLCSIKKNKKNVGLLRRSVQICSFPVTRPTLLKRPDPKVFVIEFDK